VNPQIFSVIGYVSVGLLLVLPVLWIIHWFRRPRGWLCYITLILALITFALAKINSTKHVNRIEEDRTEQIARTAAAIEKERKRKEAERAEDVADVRFAEDDRTDFLDKGGLDESDAAYYESSSVSNTTPAYKQQKIARQANTSHGDDLMAEIGGVQDKEAVDTSTVVKDIPDPIIMEKKDVALAKRLDKFNLRLSRWAIWFGLGFILVDYLRRFHDYDDSYFPLPIPDAITRAFSPVHAVQQRPAQPRREMIDECATLIRQGATFLCLTDDERLSEELPDQLNRLPFGKINVEVLPTSYHGQDLTVDFVFEELWFGRTAFIETDPLRTHELLARFSKLLADRRASGAHARRLVVLIWNREDEVPEIFEENMRVLGSSTGFQLFIC
jgi:hypothetical protein